MKILVIGGSYFFGRVFTMYATKEHDVTVANRGTYSMEEFGATQLILDRHNEADLEQLSQLTFDIVVDFCAYEPGDIRDIICRLEGIKQYVMISTVDVLEHTVGQGEDSILKKEDAPYEMRQFPGETGAYISGKVILEHELIEQCKERGINYTIIRPAILYGPYNYAPRESEYIKQILTEGHIIMPENAKGAFQFVYVKDAALMTLAIVGNKNAYNQAFNVCAPEIHTYDTFERTMAQCSDEEYELYLAEPEQMIEINMFLPFPVTADESQLYDGNRIAQITNIEYTPLDIGLKKTYDAFANIYSDKD